MLVERMLVERMLVERNVGRNMPNEKMSRKD